MSWRIFLTVIAFIVSVAGIFLIGELLAWILGKIFHIHLK